MERIVRCVQYGIRMEFFYWNECESRMELLNEYSTRFTSFRFGDMYLQLKFVPRGGKSKNTCKICFT